ncbi:MAG: YraN family protein [Pseudomonadota bacterium]
MARRSRKRTGQVAGDLSQKGLRAHLSGFCAEDMVERHYVGAGHGVVARRWRAQSGEIDLIASDGDALVFVEVKYAPSFDRAAESLQDRQIARLLNAAREFLATAPKGELTDVRFDLALVNGIGRVQVVENAIWA